MEPGDVLLERYVLIGRLGRGGMSIVWHARDLTLTRDVAIKVLRTTPGGMPPAPDSIRAEALSVAKVSHPHIARVYDYGEAEQPDGQRDPFVVMELLEGQTLADSVTDGPIAPWLAMRICADIADALAAAHAKGLVHRDVKPANVMVTDTGARIFDFGIAARIGTNDNPSGANEVIGTPTYLAPERMLGAPVTPAVDVYALGIMLYRLLVGVHPWPSRDPMEVMKAHVYASPPPLVVPGVPESVRLLYRRCLAKYPDERPSAREMAQILNQAAALTPPAQRVSVPATARAEALAATIVMPPRARHRALLAGAAVFIMLCGLIALQVATSAAPTSLSEPADHVATAAMGQPPVATKSTATPTFGGSEASRNDAPATWVSPGGTVTAACLRANAYILATTPADGFRAKNPRAESDETASVTFQRRSTKVHVKATCQGDQVHFTTV